MPLVYLSRPPAIRWRQGRTGRCNRRKCGVLVVRRCGRGWCLLRWVRRLLFDLSRGPDLVVPVLPDLDAEDQIEHKCEREPGKDDDIVDFGQGGEETSCTAENLGYYCKDGQLPSRFVRIILRNLRQLGHERDRHGTHLQELESG